MQSHLNSTAEMYSLKHRPHTCLWGQTIDLCISVLHLYLNRILTLTSVNLRDSFCTFSFSLKTEFVAKPHVSLWGPVICPHLYGFSSITVILRTFSSSKRDEYTHTLSHTDTDSAEGWTEIDVMFSLPHLSLSLSPSISVLHLYTSHPIVLRSEQHRSVFSSSSFLSLLSPRFSVPFPIPLSSSHSWSLSLHLFALSFKSGFFSS